MNVFDLHCDTVYRCLKENLDITDNELDFGASFEPDGVRGQFFAAFIPDELCGMHATEFANKLIDEFYFQTEKHQDLFSDKPKTGMITPLLSIENASALGGDIKNIDSFKGRGVKMMTLTWNGENELGYGSKCKGRLKAFGKEVVRRMYKAGMAVDVSHLNDEGFYDVIDMGSGPVCASHSSSRAIFEHERNLTDRQFSLIKESGGIVGLNFADSFLCEGQSGIEDVFRHAEHFLSIGGENVLCIGSDFDGAKMPCGVKGYDGLRSVYEYFINHGIPKKTADKIFFENAAAFFGLHIANE